MFETGMPFWKGNTHCHSTISDGALTPQEVMDYYESRGYDFLAITDHRKLSNPGHTEKGMLLLSGMEWDFNLPGQALHLVGIGMGPEVMARNLSLSPQSCINQYRRAGGRAILCHPAWSLNTISTMCALRGVTAAEIYNSTSTTPWNGERADSSLLLDMAAVQGTYYRYVAADDSHHYTPKEAGRSWTMVQSPECTWESLRDALDAGRFYATQGPQFEQVSMEDGVISVDCSPCDEIIFYSNSVWSDQRCQTGSGLTHAEYDTRIAHGDNYIRVEIKDQAGNSAWCNPIIL